MSCPGPSLIPLVIEGDQVCQTGPAFHKAQTVTGLLFPDPPSGPSDSWVSYLQTSIPLGPPQ